MKDIQQHKYSAFDAALNYITFKDRTFKEIYNKLKDKGYTEDDIETAICKLLEYKYIDDSRYAYSFIKDNIDKKGKTRITSELINKGVSKSVIVDEMSKFEFCEEEAIESEIRRKFGRVSFVDEKAKARVIGYFARRGFKYCDISRAISNLNQY